MQKHMFTLMSHLGALCTSSNHLMRSKSTLLSASGRQLARCALTVAPFLTAFVTTIASGQETIKIVSPNEFAESDAPAGTDFQCCPAYRFQQLVPAEDFSALPHGGWLTGIALRPDIDAPVGPIISEWGRFTLDLSTTNMDPDEMSTVFDDNIQTKETRVLDIDSLPLVAENVGPAGEANEFDYVVTFDEPFFYDTTQGNLLFDVTSDEILDSPYFDGFFSFQAAGNAVFGSPPDVKVGLPTVASVIEYTFVPIHAGDFNANLELDARDLDLLAAEMQSPSPDNRFDLNADDVVDFEDRRLWVEDEDFKHTYLGDSNLDGSVDSVDLNNLALNWQSSETTWEMGDFTGDGNTNAADLNLLALNWRSGQQAAISAASVPEPTSALLLAIGLVMGVTHLKYGRAKESHREQQD